MNPDVAIRIDGLCKRFGELVVLDATGHCPNLSAPQQVVGAVRRWLDAA